MADQGRRREVASPDEVDLDFARYVALRRGDADARARGGAAYAYAWASTRSAAPWRTRAR